MLKALIILTPGFPENEGDSTCIPPQQVFVKALKQVDPELKIIVLTFKYPFFSAEYNWNGVKVISFGGRNQGRMVRWFTQFRVWLTLIKLSKTYQLIGLLSFWLDKCALTGDRFSKKYNLTHYCWLLGQDARPGNKYLKRMKPDGSSLIALSDNMVKELKKNYGLSPRHIIPVGIDTALFDNMPVERNIDIVGAGSLIPLKQYAVFVEVVGFLKKDFPQIKAVICGGGPEMNMLQDTIKQLNLQNNLTLLGELPHTKVLALMQRAKVFVHTSNYEGFGFVCLEALYAGAKVVSFVRPMNKTIANWHIAEDRADMQRLVAGFLNNPANNYHPVLPYLANDNAKAVMKLFVQQEAAIS